jgi:crotonobetaine/carnitine-CoA ligase
MKEYPFEERTIGHILEDKARAMGEKIFCLHGDLRVTYQEMNERANRVANSFICLGIKKGDKVCMIMGNSLV